VKLPGSPSEQQASKQLHLSSKPSSAVFHRQRIYCDKNGPRGDLQQSRRGREEPGADAGRCGSARHLRPVQAGHGRRLQHREAGLPRLQGQVEVGGVERAEGHGPGGGEAGVRGQGPRADQAAWLEVRTAPARQPSRFHRVPALKHAQTTLARSHTHTQTPCQRRKGRAGRMQWYKYFSV
uniref:Uncharacterized protein n=1 Tax=Anopheles dirus TaxID=7168 RepID=A0A182N111_9DIPT